MLVDEAREADARADDVQTQRQLERFTLWFRNAAILFGVLALAAAIYWSDVWMGVTAFAVLLFAAMVTAGRYWLSLGHRHRAVMTVCAVIVLNTLFILGAQPVLFPTLLLAVLLPVTLSLQFARPRLRRLCIRAAITLVFVVALAGRFHRMPSRVPVWFLDVYMLGSVTVIAGLFLVLVVQWSSRLFDRLDDLRVKQREADAARREQARERARLDAMLASQQDAVIAADELGHVTLMNPAAEALTGWPFAEARLQPLVEVLVIETESGATTEEIWSRLLRGGRPFEQAREMFLITRGGMRRPIAASAAVIHHASRQTAVEAAAPRMPVQAPTIYGGIFTLRDISAQLEGFARLRQTERFELIQSMASIISRDFRFLLSVRGTSDERAPSPTSGASGVQRFDPERRASKRRIAEAARSSPTPQSAPRPADSDRHAGEPERSAFGAAAPSASHTLARSHPSPQPVPCAQILSMPRPGAPEDTGEDENLRRLAESFLALGRPPRVSPRAFDPVELLQDMAHFLPRLLGRHVTVVVRPAREVGRVYADFDRVRDVLLQLSIAARQRMATGGTVTLAVQRQQIDESASGFILGSIPAGMYVRFDVRDSGSGHTREQLLHLFEPFRFSTHREVDQALRLAATYGAIRQSSGALLIESRPRIGSTFSVYLPAADNLFVPPKGDPSLGPV